MFDPFAKWSFEPGKCVIVVYYALNESKKEHVAPALRIRREQLLAKGR